MIKRTENILFNKNIIFIKISIEDIIINNETSFNRMNPFNYNEIIKIIHDKSYEFNFRSRFNNNSR